MTDGPDRNQEGRQSAFPGADPAGELVDDGPHPNGPGEAGAAAPPKRAEEFHREQTRIERFRAKLERYPRRRLYAGMLFCTWLFLTALIGFDFRPLLVLGQPQNIEDYKVGTVAGGDVYAQRSVSYEDPIATEMAREEARNRAPIVYRQDDRIPVRQADAARGYFSEVSQIRESNASDGEKVDAVREAAPFELPEDVARSLVFLEDGALDEAQIYTVENLNELYGAGPIADDGVRDVPAAVTTVSEAKRSLSLASEQVASGQQRRVVESLSQGFLEPDYVVDPGATEEERRRAAEAVEPVSGSIMQGERVVARGEVVDRGDIARLEALGLVGGFNRWTVLFGVAIVVATEMWVAWYFLERFGRRILKRNPLIRLLLAALLLVLFTVLARLFVLFSLPSYLIPLAGLSILGTMLLGPRLMFVMVVIASVNTGIIAGNDFFLTAALVLVSGFAIYTVLRVGPRTELLRAGLLIALVSGVVTFAVALIGGSNLTGALTQGGIGIANGLLSLMLAMVLLPLLENAFNILTPQKLLELADTGNPLLHKLLEGAPGTFTHSMQVGSLAANAAERIGADPLLARVGAYYHDIGKLEHPQYFIENQIARINPHKSLTPALSARVIKRHVKDGLEIGREWNLPIEVLDLIREHHGTTRIEYFYRKALEDALGGDLAGVDVREPDFRYPGPRPRTKEAGILMLADSVEATVKSLEKPTRKRIEDIVEGTIRHKLEDGQFDDCELTMREIHETGDAIRDALIGFIGPRIEYPEAPADAKKPVPN